MSKNRRLLGAATALALLVTAACGGDDGDQASASSGGDGSDETINIVGFAVPEAANKAIAEAWAETPEGEGVEFVTSYGASGDQSRAVVSGLEADYVHFSVESDVTRPAQEGGRRVAPAARQRHDVGEEGLEVGLGVRLGATGLDHLLVGGQGVPPRGA